MTTPLALLGPAAGAALAFYKNLSAEGKTATWFDAAQLPTVTGDSPALWCLEPPLMATAETFFDFLRWFERLLGAAAAQATPWRVVLLSSAEVYGQPVRQPVLVADPIAPDTLLGARALMAEAPLLAALNGGTVAGAVLRLGEIAGAAAPAFSPFRALSAGEGPLRLPSAETPVCVAASAHLLHSLRGLLFPAEGPAPAPWRMYQLGGAPRPLGLVMDDWQRHPHHPLGREVVFETDRAAPTLWTRVLDTAALQAHLGHTAQSMALGDQVFWMEG